MLFQTELQYRRKYGIIVGVDEAGRGPLAGPVVAAACILSDLTPLAELNDSKQLSEKKREMLFNLIIEHALEYSIEIVDVEIIDSLNILNATLLGMAKVVGKLKTAFNYVLIDGNRTPRDIRENVEAIVKGDGKVACIAAASILAKVTRDRIMIELDEKYPHYGFAKHKGYPTKEHLCAIERYGICQHHRKSYKPVAEAVSKRK